VIKTWAKTNTHALAEQIIVPFLVGTLVFLILLTTRAAEQTRDSLVYAYSAKTGSELFHPHHLLYTPVIRLFSLGLKAVCAACDEVIAAQLHNILWSTAGVLAFFWLVRHLLGTTAGLLAGCLLLFMRGFW
jgi:hypothetical protein